MTGSLLSLYCCLPQRLKRHSYAAFYCFQQRKMHRLLCTVTAPVHPVCYTGFYHNGQGGRMMTKDFLLRLTEEHYGAGAFPVYGRLLTGRSGTAKPIPSRTATRRSWGCGSRCRRAYRVCSKCAFCTPPTGSTRCHPMCRRCTRRTGASRAWDCGWPLTHGRARSGTPWSGGAWRLRTFSRSGRTCTTCCGSTRRPSSGGKTVCRGRSRRMYARGSTPRRGCRS